MLDLLESYIILMIISLQKYHVSANQITAFLPEFVAEPVVFTN